MTRVNQIRQNTYNFSPADSSFKQNITKTASAGKTKSAPPSHTFSGTSVYVHWYQKIKHQASETGAKTLDYKKSRSADILVLGGHHYGNYAVGGRVRPGRFSRGENEWDLHKTIGRKPINKPRLIMITGCNAINGASMSYYAKQFSNALVFGSCRGVDPKKKAGSLIQKFWVWIGKQELGKLDWKKNPAHRRLLAKKFEQFVEIVGKNNPEEIAGMGWFDTTTGQRRVFIRDKKTNRGRWITQDFSKLLPKKLTQE